MQNARRATRRTIATWLVFGSIGATSIARAQTSAAGPVEASGGTTSSEVTGPRHESTEGEVSAGSAAKVTPFGYVEAAWQWNFNRPSNGITNFRGFDNRTGFTLDDVVLGASFEHQDVVGKISFQVGHTPATYYLAEPTSPGTPGAASTDATYWRFLQEAHVGWKAPVGDGLLIEGGLFLSPIGVEGLAINDRLVLIARRATSASCRHARKARRRSCVGARFDVECAVGVAAARPMLQASAP